MPPPLYSGSVDKVTLRLQVALDSPGRKHFEPDFWEFTWTPSSFTDNIQAQWQEQSTLGRSEPWQSYGSTGARQISFELTLQAEQDPLEDVVRPGRWLEALSMPVYVGNRMFSPPILHFIWGRMFNFRCRAAQSSVTWNGPFDVDTLYPMNANVSLAFTAVSSRAPSWADIAGGRPNG